MSTATADPKAVDCAGIRHWRLHSGRFDAAMRAASSSLAVTGRSRRRPGRNHLCG
jgi:hypothetical protein